MEKNTEVTVEQGDVGPGATPAPRRAFNFPRKEKAAMTTEHHHGHPQNDDSRIVTFAGSSVNSIPGAITDIEYESALESTRAERTRQAREADWDADPDWQAFQRLCYSDTEAPDAETTP